MRKQGDSYDGIAKVMGVTSQSIVNAIRLQEEKEGLIYRPPMDPKKALDMFLDGKSMREIAKIHGISLSGVSWSIRRYREKLKEQHENR